MRKSGQGLRIFFCAIFETELFMEQNQRFMESEHIGRLMARYAVPCTISLLVAALYNIVDQLFIANTPELGSFGNAANTVVFPLTVVALAIAVMIGDGCCSFVSMAIGGGNTDDAAKSVGNAIGASAASGVALMLVYLLCSDALLSMFGGRVNAETFAYAKEYFFWIALGIPFYVFGQALNPIVRADGSPRFAMVATVSGAVVNLILDPLFLYAFHWGMTGAAVATVLGQILTAALEFGYLFRLKSIRLHRVSFRPAWRVLRRVLALGLTSFLAQISLVAAMAAINNMLRVYGAKDPLFEQEAYAQIPMAVVGIVMKVFQIVISISIGMAAGCIPIAGYNAGAGRFDRVKALLRMLLASEAVLGAIALLVVELFPRALIGMFGAANESAAYTDFAVKAFRIYLCMTVLACVNKATFIFLQSMGKAFLSAMLSVVREVVFGVGFALLLPLFFGLNGVLYSMPVSDVLTFVLSCAVLLYLDRTVLNSGKAIQA